MSHTPPEEHMQSPTANFDLDLLTELTETGGVPGYEDRIREIVRQELAEHVDTVQTDTMGNVVGTLVGGDDSYTVAVAAHMDEIGFMVRHIKTEAENGFLEIDALGGWDPRILKAQRVTVHTDDGDLPGVIGSPPPHTLDADERDESPTINDVVVDLGLPAETVEDRVSRGDLITMAQTTERVGDTVTGKALDDRVCLLALLEAARAVNNPDVTIHFCATVQEEVGLRGARSLGVDIDPDLAIALDVTVANDVPGFSAGEYVTELGAGAAIKLKDSSVLTNPKVHRRMQAIAAEYEIPSQLEILPAGGTDTAGFQQSHGARPVGAISVPTRYLHTPTEMAHTEDINAVIGLLTAFLDSEDGSHDYRL